MGTSGGVPEQVGAQLLACDLAPGDTLDGNRLVGWDTAARYIEPV